MAMPQQVANQGAVITDPPRAFTVADTGSLNDAAVIAHHINKADEAFIEHWEFVPAKRFNQRRAGCGG